MNVEIRKLIDRLQALQGPDRNLDTDIAKLVGWTSRSELSSDGSGRTRTVWMLPTTSVPGRVPAYTENIHDAYQLAQIISPSNVGGVSWEDGEGHARLEGGHYWRGATPAIALCLAAIATRADAGS
ncbi:hypothetical protein JL39_04490 [Rhizobium sp. YS-1r]|nr:hypothetical protein JL39_04490 [Rhizobium sp. YS-1r]